MCTVSFIPSALGGFLLTSNRDEKTVRPTSAPVFQNINKHTVWFPQDLLAGGTWIAVSDNGRTCCLMNGGFEKHTSQKQYRKSRGKIVLEVFQYDEIDQFFENTYLDDTEPFSLVIAESVSEECNRLIRLTWDGNCRHVDELDPNKAHLWSSVTLYDPNIRQHRKKLFEEWICNHPEPSSKEVLAFHSAWHGEGDRRNMIFSKEGELQTVSITQIHQNNIFSELKYIDLKGKTSSEKSILNNHAISLQ